MASGVRAETCGPRCKAAVMCCLDHGCPQSTGHPVLPQESSMGAAGCDKVNKWGHVVLPIASRCGEYFGMVSLQSKVSMMVEFIFSGVQWGLVEDFLVDVVEGFAAVGSRLGGGDLGN